MSDSTKYLQTPILVKSLFFLQNDYLVKKPLHLVKSLFSLQNDYLVANRYIHWYHIGSTQEDCTMDKYTRIAYAIATDARSGRNGVKYNGKAFGTGKDCYIRIGMDTDRKYHHYAAVYHEHEPVASMLRKYGVRRVNQRTVIGVSTALAGMVDICCIHPSNET